MKRFGKYEVLEKIAAGGFGEVYKGFDPAIKRTVAIKTCISGDDALLQRFQLEAEIAGNLHHPNITTIYDFGQEGDRFYLVQELLGGEGLDQKVKERQQIADELKLEYLRQTARALRHAHEQGVIHRDIKPSNVHVLPDGTVKILDFGIARLTRRETGLTTQGQTMGTTAFLAPEQVRGDAVDHRTDIFSFGALAYELMTYQRAFKGETASALLYQILEREPQPLAELWKPARPRAVALINRCLEKDPDLRVQSFAEIETELAEIVGQEAPAVGLGEAPLRPPAATAAPADTGSAGWREAETTARPADRGGGRWLWAAAAVVLLGAGVWLGWPLLRGAEPASSNGTAASAGEPAAEGGLDATGQATSQATGPATGEAATDEVDAPADAIDAGADPVTAPTPDKREFEVVSRPPGAAVRVNGVAVGVATPATLKLSEGDRIELDLDGHETVGYTFAVDAVTEDQERLFFPLTPVIPPGVLIARADYPLSLEIGGKVHGPRTSHELALPPGRYVVRMRAREVFLDRSLTVDIDSDGRRALAVPAAHPVRIEAFPTSARVEVAGVELGGVPVDVRLAEGAHEVVFDWGGVRLPTTQRVSAETDRIFERKPAG